MNNTIAAISTPPGVGGIAVVRLSGPEAFAIAARHVALPTEGHTTRFSPFSVGDEVLDEVVVTLFRAPHSYTGLDTVEFSCHGSLYVQQTLLQSLLDSGARLADPGEFTRQAFLSGRLDLSQAEAVADLIDATNSAAHRLALSQLRGGYAHELETLRSQLVELTSLLELELDFSEEDVEFADRSRLRQLVDETDARVRSLRSTFGMGNALKNGIPVAILGRPNAGKSSLLNALLHDDRAIVSPIPGTTRDTIEETLVLDGTPFRFIDTAGLRQSVDPVEALGIDRSIAAAERAEIVLYVHDGTQPLSEAEDDLRQLDLRAPRDGRQLLLVINKTDLAQPPSPIPHGAIPISAKAGTGLDTLRQALADSVKQRLGGSTQGVMLTNLRHYEALGHVDEALGHVAEGLEEGLPADLVAIDLRDALHHLGTITGQITSDEVLGNIFSRFCIGK